MESITWIRDGQKILAVVVRTQFTPSRTTFVSPPDFNLQLGFVVYPTGGVIKPHYHKKAKRTIMTTSETLLVKEGRVEASIFNKQQVLVETIILEEGDLISLVAGGHGFRVLEKAILIEVKQGPYLAEDDKVRFGDDQ